MFRNRDNRVFQSLRIRFTAVVSLFSVAVIALVAVFSYVSFYTTVNNSINSSMDEGLSNAYLEVLIPRSPDESDQNSGITNCMYIIVYETPDAPNRRIMRINFDRIASGNPSDAESIRLMVLNEGATEFNVSGRDYRVKTAKTFSIDRPAVQSVYVIYDCTNMMNSLFLARLYLIITLILSPVFSICLMYILSGFFLKPAKEAMDRQKELIANASHELKTPLTILNADIEVLKNDSEKTVRENEKWIESIETQAEKMSGLVTQMLTLSKIDSSAEQIVEEDAEVSSIVEGAILSFEAPLFEKGIAIKGDFEKEIHAKIYRTGYEKIVNILIENAMKYTTSGDTINVELKADKKDIVLTVSNPGTIAKEDIPKLFDRFYRSREDQAEKSFGLGLAMAKALTENMNGKISCRCENETVFFSVSIPFVAASSITA